MTMNNESSKALVRVDSYEPEVLMTDKMGSDIVAVEVGSKKKLFVVHKKLMMDASVVLENYLAIHPDTSKAYPLHSTVPEVFGFFVEVLYSGRVPGVNADSSNIAQAIRITTLCRFYAFCIHFKVKQAITEMVWDVILDGFRIMDSFPEYGLIQNVYRHTHPGDKLRKFCADSLLYSFIRGTDESIKDGSLETLLQAEFEILHDFLDGLRFSGGNIRDPREEGAVKQQALKG